MVASVMVTDVPGIDYPGRLERFEEPDTNDGVACVPTTSNPANVALVPLTNTDIIESFTFRFKLKTSGLGAYTGTDNLSPMFPYNFIGKLEVPFQSRSLAMGAMDGHLWFLANQLRKRNKKYSIDPDVAGQAAILSTGYTAQANLQSASNYSVAASTAEEYDFTLDVPAALYFEHFYDTLSDGKGSSRRVRYDEVYVSPFLMSSSGRSVIPILSLNPVQGSLYDASPLVHSGTATTLPAWTDSGSTLSIRRNGWRQPLSKANFPPLFTWAHNWFTTRYALSSAKFSQVIPSEGQVLAIICRMFDPTLNSGLGGMIPLSNLSSLTLQYGSGIAKFNDTPSSVQRRLLQQHGYLPTEGVFIWDMYADTRSNLDALNTYDTAGITIKLDFGTNTPGASSYIDVAYEFLTTVGG